MESEITIKLFLPDLLCLPCSSEIATVPVSPSLGWGAKGSPAGPGAADGIGTSQGSAREV